jgi:exodeoxyribonuclease VII large subunit
MTTVHSITEITGYLRRLIESDDLMRDVWVQGEVSNIRLPSSGHWYFTLKDDSAQLKSVMWRSDARRQTVTLQEGDSIKAHGRISVYDQRGDYQFYADLVQPLGIGDLYAQFEQLKLKLEAEGFFDPTRKKPLPAFPLRIGVVTSASAAAFQDVRNVLARRFPLADVVLSPTLVQGAEAPPQIADAIRRLDETRGVDVILVVRGGGSLEDLWAFNDERVARAVFEAVTPIVSGVGHETDFTIIDFVADNRAPTPSAAAEVASPNLLDLHGAVDEQRIRLGQAMQAAITRKANAVRGAAQTLHYLSPAATLRNARQQVDEMRSRLKLRQGQQLALLHERLNSKAASLEAASPQRILQRGYAIVQRRDDGTVVKAPGDAPAGTAITLRLAGGDLHATTEDHPND